jgi:hypothetical protein
MMWLVVVTIEVGIIGLATMCGKGITSRGDFVGSRIRSKFGRNENDADPLEPVELVVTVVVEVAGVWVGVLVGILVGVVAGILVGMVGILGILGGIIGMEVMTEDGFIVGDIGPIDRRARPSSCSSENDAFLLDRRPAEGRWLCSSCGFIVSCS